eukprot:6173798-Pleurochrysis_carterae.AAC.2
MAPVNVLSTRVVFWVVREVDGRRVVHVQSGGLLGIDAELANKSPEVDGLLCGLRGRHDFRFAGGQRDSGLLFGGPGYGSLPEQEYVAGRGVTRRPSGV